jgi:lipoprotein-anchoring transpeptidase ErfK/SrfK
MIVARIRAFLFCAAALAACPADAAQPVAAPPPVPAPVSMRPQCPAPAAKPSARAVTPKTPEPSTTARPATRRPVDDLTAYGDAHYAASDLQREIARFVAQQDCMDHADGDRFGSDDAWRRIDADNGAGDKGGDKAGGTP